MKLMNLHSLCGFSIALTSVSGCKVHSIVSSQAIIGPTAYPMCKVYIVAYWTVELRFIHHKVTGRTVVHILCIYYGGGRRINVIFLQSLHAKNMCGIEHACLISASACYVHKAICWSIKTKGVEVSA